MTDMKKTSGDNIDFFEWGFFDEEFINKPAQKIFTKTVREAFKDDPPSLTLDTWNGKMKLRVCLPLGNPWVFYKVDLIKIFKEWSEVFYENEEDKKRVISTLHKIIKMLENAKES